VTRFRIHAADDQEVPDARCARPRDGLCAVDIELRHVDMAVRVDEEEVGAWGSFGAFIHCRGHFVERDR
jgi:hypothetical protein